MGRIAKLFELVEAGHDMRQLQKKFFRNRDRKTLDESKAAEKKFDKILDEVWPANKSTQSNLF